MQRVRRPNHGSTDWYRGAMVGDSVFAGTRKLLDKLLASYRQECLCDSVRQRTKGSLVNSMNLRNQEVLTLALHSCVLLILLSLALGFRQYEVYKHDRDLGAARIERNLGLIQGRSDGYLNRLEIDAEFIAKSPILRMYLEDPSPKTLPRAQEALLLFASLRPYLDQVRYIDQHGMERIRIDHRDGQIRLAPQLQDKSDRDYVKAGLALKDGGIHFSDIDLNIEHGQIERPFQPMLRVVGKTTANDRAAGMIVFNAKVDELVREFQTVLSTKDQQLVALNSDGGWILGGGAKDWLFAAEPSAQAARLSDEAPELWAQIKANPSGQFEYQGECHYYRWYQYKDKEVQSPQLLVAQRSQGRGCDYMTNSAIKSWAKLLALSLAFTLPLLALWHLSRARERSLQRLLRDSHAQLELVTSEVNIGLLMVDHQCRVLWVNPEAERLLGWKATDLIGENLHERIHQKDGKSLHSGPCPTLQAIQTGERQHKDRDRIKTQSGDVLDVSMGVSPYREGKGEERIAIVTIVDVREFVARENRLHLLATTDPLTGALNRRSLMEHLQAMVDDPKMQLCVLMADIDFFKKVNDINGHAAGDLVLKNFTKTMSSLLRKGDLLGRIGGEEFVVALGNTDLKSAQALAERLRLAAENSRTQVDDGSVISITASFGVAVYNGNESIEALLARADAALYQAKHTGRNRVETARNLDI